MEKAVLPEAPKMPPRRAEQMPPSIREAARRGRPLEGPLKKRPRGEVRSRKGALPARRRGARLVRI